MVKKRSFGQRAFEIIMVLLTVPVYWVVFYFVIINSFKPQVEAKIGRASCRERV